MQWSLYDKNGELKPFMFSNGKSQQDIVKEVIEAFREGCKIVFIRGICGTGKSAIALNIAKELGRASVVVPVKTLQAQYKKDYTEDKYVIKADGEKQRITVIDGRNNHGCPFLKCSCDDQLLPCTIEINSENKKRIKDYIKSNPFVNLRDFRSLKDVRRKSIAPACPYWSPIICRDWFGSYRLEDAQEIEYNGLNGKCFIYYKRKEGCGYYDQFMSYFNSDVIVFNSSKYEVETLMDRKPSTDVEIIDECDEFLDSLAAEKKISLDRLSKALSSLKIDDLDMRERAIELNGLVLGIINKHSKDAAAGAIYPLKKTEVFNLLLRFLDGTDFVNLEDDIAETLYNVYKTAVFFKDVFDDSYVSFGRNKLNELVANIVTINLKEKLKEFTEKNKFFVMMSGTIHSDEVLRGVFGIEEYTVIEAETEWHGNITPEGTGLEMHFNYASYKSNRGRFLSALSACVREAEPPALVHVTSYKDLPTEEEIKRYGLLDLKSQDGLREMQEKYRRGELLEMFKKGQIKVLYSTNCRRGVDLPGDMCKSIIFTRFPYPDINSLFWRVLRLSRPEQYQMFYFDMARRNFMQQLYRGLRSKNDHIYLLSPDLRVLSARV